MVLQPHQTTHYTAGGQVRLDEELMRRASVASYLMLFYTTH